jgi:lysophospholipase L1-like esterase
MRNILWRASVLSALSLLGVAHGAPLVEHLAKPPKNLAPLAAAIHGRAIETAKGEWKSQWPGVYAETPFSGGEILLHLGPERVIVHFVVDGTEVAKLVRPAPGTYRVGGLSPGHHVLRLEIASENEDAPVTFGGFATSGVIKQPALPARARQIEFIGDSHTVGYGNTSAKRECTQDEVWATTDTSQTFGPIIARHYEADYQINALSGRGIVRNYGGFAADPLPVVSPFTLFDKASRYSDTRWNPQIVVIALGTNDFSTPLKPGEHWSSREALHADYEETYVAFLKSLRARLPKALIALWATDLSEGEIQAEVRKVVERVTAQGDRSVIFVPVNGLKMEGCDWHPSLEDERTIAQTVIDAIDARRK